MRSLNEIRHDLLDEEGRFLKLQDLICQNIEGFLGSVGFLSNGFRNTKAEPKAKRWVWENDYGLKIEFSNPVYKDMLSVRRPPIEKSRKAEEAMLLTTSNRSGATITRGISKEVTVATNAKILESNTFNFNVTTGLEAGIEGAEANFGARFIASVQASFGGEFLRQWESDKGHSTTRKIEDSLQLEPYSEYRISAMLDKIELEQEIDISGNVDFAITITIPDYRKAGSKAFNANIQLLKPKQTIKGDDIRGLCRSLIGLTGDIFKKDVDKNRSLDKHRIVSAFNVLLKEENRRIETTTKLSYKEAGDASLTIDKVGIWSKKDGKWVLNKG